MITRCNQGIYPVYDKGLNPFNKPRDIIKFIDLFKKSNADIICLQEVVPIITYDIINDIDDYEYIRNNFNFKYLNKLMYDIGYKYKIIASTQTAKAESETYYFLANAIYSKIKLYNSKIYNNNILNRNYIVSNINYNNNIITIINCHLEYKNIIKNNIDYTSTQFKLLENIIKSIPNSIIIAGDFNINLYHNKNLKHYNNWENKVDFLKNNFINTNKDIITNFHQNDTTDYILLSNNSQIKYIYSKTINTYLSDHYPIITDFK